MTAFTRLLVLASMVWAYTTSAAEPLRIFIRGGPKTHGPEGNGLHDHRRFLGDFTGILSGRGAKVDGALNFPTGDQLKNTDVLVMFAAEAGSIAGADRENLDAFLKRGGGIVCLHDAVCGTNAPWFKTVIGGAWEHGRSKWFEGPISFYYVDHEHPITHEASNFDIDDEMYWDLHMMPEAKILAGTWVPDRRNTRDGRPNPHIYEIAPQMWTYEKTLEGGKPYRAFVSLLGHKYSTFQQPHVRGVLFRGIAWAAGRDPALLCTKEELASLRYPEGGPTHPSTAKAKLELHPEFTMKVVASEPLINKPINVDWDPQGRLWVAETPEYPNGRRGIRPNFRGQEWKDGGGLVDQAGIQDRPAQDRISVLTDKDGDGVMDSKVVWHEGLDLVTGFVLHKDGIIAAAAPDVLLIRDTNGDGKSDSVSKLYTGLGTFDTHAVINNLRWGLDGWIYATHGYSAGDVVSAVNGKAFGRIGSGVVRFKPDGSAFEQYSSKGGNTWGLDFSWDGDLFYTQPTSGDLLMTVLLPESELARTPGAKPSSFQVVIKSPKSYPLMKPENLAYVQIDWVGSFTAAAGAAIYSGGSWPSAYNGHYFTTEPTINVVHHEEVKPAALGYSGQKLRTEEFIGSRDLWFRPIETRIGPDGALYVLDFYNQAVIHNDTRGPTHNNVNAAVRPDRDHYFGRIWKVDHKEAKPLPPARLNGASKEDLMAALGHPNRAIQMSAHRLLAEQGAAGLPRLAADPNASTAARIHALWLSDKAGVLNTEILANALGSADPALQKTAARIAARPSSSRSSSASLEQALLKSAKTGTGAARLEALVALSHLPPSEKIASEIVAIYPDLKDPWLESAARTVAVQDANAAIKAALASPRSSELAALAEALATHAASGDATGSGRLLETLAGAPAGAAVKKAALEGLLRGTKRDATAPWSASIKGAFQTLLSSPDASVQTAALPLAARWDARGELGAQAAQAAQNLLASLKKPNLDEPTRRQLITSLAGVQKLDANILPSIGSIIGSSDSVSLQEHALRVLGDLGGADASKVLAEAFPRTPPSLRENALGQLLKRPESAQALLAALKSGAAPVSLLGPAGLHRLRYHPDAGVAKASAPILDDLRGPEAKEKQALIARLTPEVSKAGNVEKGKMLFTQNCATCHRFGDEGKEVGPVLTGMGSHGAAELLGHILDPNKEVDPSFAAWNFETKEGESLDGIIARENRASVFVRNAAGEIEIKRDNVASQTNTGRSLMPEGFESLGSEGLRDLLAYMTAADSRYRVLDMRAAFTADSTKGIYRSDNSPEESLKFRRFGMVQVGPVPFEIMSPNRSPGGRNVTVLRGGDAMARKLPQKVEIAASGVTASKLHFLGGVAGWGFPCCGEHKDLPVAKVSVKFADGKSEEFVLKNGVEFADYNGMTDVPGSQYAPDIVPRGQQVRWFTKNLSRKADITSITLESFDNSVAPTFVAITAEAGDVVKTAAAASSAPTASAQPKAQSFDWGQGVRTLLVGGGSSHDFQRWFRLADLATLQESKGFSAHYTEQYADVPPALQQIDVLCWSANQPQKDTGLRKAIMDFADAGKGLVLLHAGNWRLWNDWPEWNRILAGGGSQSHDRYGEFEVTSIDSSHPVMKGVPASFRISDELYHHKQDADGAAAHPLATGRNLATGKTYPVVWITKHPKARIVNITLGHDGLSHDHPAYKALLKNALAWASGKPVAAAQ